MWKHGDKNVDLTLLAKDSPQLQSTQSNSPLALDASVTRAAQAMQIKAARLVTAIRIQPARLAGRASFSGHLKQSRKSSTMETRTPVTELKRCLLSPSPSLVRLPVAFSCPFPFAVELSQLSGLTGILSSFWIFWMLLALPFMDSFSCRCSLPILLIFASAPQHLEQ